MIVWSRVVGFLLVGYLVMAKSFAYLGVPPIFIGEVVLAAFLLLKPRVALGTWASSLLRPSPLNGFAFALLLFVAYGIWQVGRGALSGIPLIYTLKFFVFNYYTIYIFMGLWVGLHRPQYLPKLVRTIAWINAIYGLLYIVFLRNLTAHIPGTDNVPLFSAPTGQVVVLLGLLCFERNLLKVWPLLVLNIVVTLVWQVRAEWFGLALGILAWGLLTGRFSRVVATGLAALTVLGLIELAGIKLAGRNGEPISLSENVARIIAPIDIDIAKQLSPNAAWHAGTAEWRELWWDQIWLSIHATSVLEFFGHGYGFDLWGLAPLEMRLFDHSDIRTPHSVFFYALAYTGWVGVALFSLLQATIFSLQWRSYRLAGDPSGVVWWAMGLGMAFFQEGFETPFHAIPFYLMAGLTMAPGLQPVENTRARLPRAQSAPGAGAPRFPVGALRRQWHS